MCDASQTKKDFLQECEASIILVQQHYLNSIFYHDIFCFLTVPERKHNANSCWDYKVTYLNCQLSRYWHP